MQMLFALTCLAIGVSLVDPQIRIRQRPPEGGDRVLLTASNLSCDGVFKTPNINTGAYTPHHPVALRVNGASRKYYQIDGANSDIYEFNEPSLSACNTALASITQATVAQNWGAYPVVSNGGGLIPGEVTGYTGVYGLHYDEQRGYLWIGWSNGYVNIPPGNAFAAASFGASTLSRVGCYALNARTNTVGMPMQASGVIKIPDWFLTQVGISTSNNLGVGVGGIFASTTSLNSYGPSIEAIPMPSGNSCTAGVDNFLATGTVLARYPTNTTGPHCAQTSGHTIGCTPVSAPTPPYHAQSSFTGYGYSLYEVDWDPYGGHGWWGSDSPTYGNWYDDGVKTGVIYSMLMPSGGLSTTVSASPAPTYDAVPFYPETTFTVPATMTRDGNHIRVSDVIWVQTCTPGSTGGAGCVTTNNNHMSICSVTAVNTGTGSVTCGITGSDAGDLTGRSDYRAVVGGAVWHGVIYAHGTKFSSRSTLRLQIYNPQSFAAVVAGGNTYDPVYAEEIDLTTFVTQYGCPSCGTAGINPNAAFPAATLVDNTNRKIVLFFRNPDGITAMGMVFSVN
ncbi:MAG: hypothetical protein EPO40_01345 [Myxococcaceae bacterium]|nr:MAG: hypothetical protein EPO40_01345 [Myxococcaceae bacterium]